MALNVGMNIPLIGSRPPPEMIEEHYQKVQAMEALWPITPFPLSGNGIKVPAYWMGKTLLDEVALTILAQANIQGALSNGQEAMENLVKKVWIMADIWMQLRPVGTKQQAEAKTAPSGTHESTGTEEESSILTPRGGP